MKKKQESTDEKCPLCNRYLKPNVTQLKAMLRVLHVGVAISLTLGICIGIVGLVARLIWNLW